MKQDAWYRELADGRVEIFAKGDNISLKVSAPETDAWKFVALFEEATGLEVSGARRPSRKSSVIKGQMSLTED